MAANLKETLHALADRLPEDVTWDDVLEEVRFHRAVEAGISAADRCEFAGVDEIREAFTNWDVKVGD